MEDFEKIIGEDRFEEEISYQIDLAYCSMYECFTLGNPVKIAKKIGSRKEIEDLIEHFTSKEEFEKCHFLSEILKKI
jgi:hypothetical protein